MFSNVEHPSHYTWLKEKCGIEVIDIVRHLDFDTGNAIKYLLRYGRKHDTSMTDIEKAIEDLEKAIFYIKDKIELLKREKVTSDNAKYPTINWVCRTFNN